MKRTRRSSKKKAKPEPVEPAELLKPEDRPTPPNYGPEAKSSYREMLFANAFIRRNFNATDAAKDAGYNGTRGSLAVLGSRLLKKETVKGLIQKALNKQNYRFQLDSDFVLQSLMEIVERCMQKEPIRDRKGRPTGQWKFADRGANKALELLGKHLKLWTERMEITGPGGGPIQLAHYDLSKLGAGELKTLRRLLKKAKKDESDMERALKGKVA